MFDDFLYKNRFIIGGVLIALILGGAAVITWENLARKAKNKENDQMAELKTQNDLLRQQLSEISQKQVAGTSTSETENQSDKININTADTSELDKLPGIGPARAADIINYRETKGGFKSIEELKNIKGVGDKTFESLKDLITVGE